MSIVAHQSLPPWTPRPYRIASRIASVALCLMLGLVLADAAPARTQAGFHPALPQAYVQSSQRPNDARSGSGSDQSESNPQRKNKPPTIAPYQAAERARARFGGRVLNVMLEHGPSGPYYRVRLLRHGRVRVVDIDAHR